MSMEYLQRYLEVAPAALAIERSLECELLSDNSLESPILDVGCGDGLFASVFTSVNTGVGIDTGIDIDPGEARRALSLGTYGEVIVTSAHDIPKPDNTFATVFSNSVLEHIEDIGPVLKEIHRVLKPNGKFYLTVPTDELEKATIISRILDAIGLAVSATSYASFYNSFWKHFHAYDVEAWQSLFANTGFRVEKHQLYAPRNFSTFYDAIIPMALPSWISKAIFNRWIFWPAFRKLYVRFLHWLIQQTIMKLKDNGKGTLVMFVLVK